MDDGYDRICPSGILGCGPKDQDDEEEGDEDRDLDVGDTAPWGEQQREIDWLESRFDGPEPYEPSPYDGTYSEE